MNDETIGVSAGKGIFDKQALAELATTAVGGRSISDVVAQTGLSRSTISKILNQKLRFRPSIVILRRLAGEESSPLFRAMLEACGYPNEWQDYLAANNVRSYIYVSYSHRDKDVVKQIVDRMERHGFRVFRAESDLLASPDLHKQITEVIDHCTVFVFVISSASLESDYCQAELEYALSIRKKVIPVMLEDYSHLRNALPQSLHGILGLRYAKNKDFYQRLYEGLQDCRNDRGDFIEGTYRREIYRSLFNDRIEGKSVSLNEIKVIFLGDGETGKSHTIARLLNDGGEPKDYTDQATPGIVIKNKEYNMNGREFRVHFWDFGGQEILHSMHRIFLTERTLYVVLVNARDETQDARALYWLHNIQSFAPNAPVILVMNKMDQNPNASLNERDLCKKYTGLRRVIKMSALKDSADELNKNLRDAMLDEIVKSDVLDKQWRESWLKVKNALEEMKTDFIDGKEYRRICDECGVGVKWKDAEDDEDDEQKEQRILREQKELLHWFNDLGVSFCCYDDYKLENYIILRPEWITNALYIMLFNVCEGTKNGLLPHEGICKLLNPSQKDRDRILRVLPDITYDYDEVMYVLNVIRKFQLSFKGKEEHEFIPMLCQHDSMPVLEDYEHDPNTLEFQMEFEYLPNNVLHRLMVERQQELNMENVWLTGALFEQKATGLSAVVTIDGNLLRIFVRSNNPMHKPNTYLSILKGNVDSIWQDMNLRKPNNKLVYKLNGRQEIFSYEMLNAMLKVGQTQAFSMTWMEMVPIWDIMNQSAPAAADDRRRLLGDIVTACQLLQSNPDCWDLDENGRNTQVRNALRLRGYVVHDQTLLGISGGGKTAGELDMDIRRYENTPWTICEAIRVRDGSKADWDKHLSKLLDNYNPHGAPFLFLLTYVDCEKEKFDNIWGGFQSHIQTCGTEQFALVPDSYAHFADEKWEDNYYIQTVKSQYQCGGYTPAVYHIFVRIGR